MSSIIQGLIQELEFRGNRKENIERAEALKRLLKENEKLQQENIVLNNTRDMCPITRTSGIRCGLKEQ